MPVFCRFIFVCILSFLFQSCDAVSSVCPDYATWRSEHPLFYRHDVVELGTRERIYTEKCELLDTWNRAHKGSSFWLGPNTRFIDRLPVELDVLISGARLVQEDPSSRTSTRLDTQSSQPRDTWSEIDWRYTNSNPKSVAAVTEVKDQGECGACWSFSVLATVEAAVAIQHGILNDYSEQELVDCVVSNGGCSGGIFSTPYQYIEANGVALYDDYPYNAEVGACEAVSKAVQISSYVTVKTCDVSAVQRALQEVGPLSVSIDASCDSFLYYAGGVLSEGCGSVNNNHAVTLIGYNTDPNDFGMNYWIIKNSWSKTWGIKGYMYLAMDLDDPSSGGSCGICNMLKQPLGVYPQNTTSFVNTTYPSPKIDADDEDNECDHITIFGRKVGGSSNSGVCYVVIWLASPHSILTWVIAFAVTAVVTCCLSTAVRKCYQVLCCSSTNSNSPSSNRNRRKGQVVVLNVNDLNQTLLDDDYDGFSSD